DGGGDGKLELPWFSSQAQRREIIEKRLTHRNKEEANIMIVACRSGRSTQKVENLMRTMKWAGIPEIWLVDGLTPFLLGSKYGHSQLVAFFINQDPSRVFNEKSLNGWSALHWAARGGHADTLRVLVATLRSLCSTSTDPSSLLKFIDIPLDNGM